MDKSNNIDIAYLNGSLTKKLINMGKQRHTLAIKNNPKIEANLVNLFKDSRFCLDHLLFIKRCMSYRMYKCGRISIIIAEAIIGLLLLSIHSLGIWTVPK